MALNDLERVVANCSRLEDVVVGCSMLDQQLACWSKCAGSILKMV